MKYKSLLILAAAGLLLMSRSKKTGLKRMEKISEHITYDEATRSATAQRYGLDNTPTPEHLQNMIKLAFNVFEPLRTHFGKPIKIESFYRSKLVNAKTPKASSNSQHMTGQAIDIDNDYGGFTNAELFFYILKNLPFDQLIWEFGTDKEPAWVHVSYVGPGANRKKITKAYVKNGEPEYMDFNLNNYKQYI